MLCELHDIDRDQVHPSDHETGPARWVGFASGCMTTSNDFMRVGREPVDCIGLASAGDQRGSGSRSEIG